MSDDEEARWLALGLYDPAAPAAASRLAVLRHLAELGCTAAEMTEADRAGRLFALAGDRVIRPQTDRVSFAEAAADLGCPEPLLRRGWTAFGLPLPPAGSALTVEEVGALRTWVELSESLGEASAAALARVIGSSLARIADAESSVMRARVDGITLERTGDELVTAQAFEHVAGFVPRIGQLLDVMHRVHLELTRAHFEVVAKGEEGLTVRCGVGFADLCGFTEASAQIPLASLPQVLASFEEAAAAVIAQNGSRLVKFLGDGVMWVSGTPEILSATASALVGHPGSALPVRAGVAFGTLVAADGDYFGHTVNVAARLAALAGPREVVGTVAALAGADLPVERVELRGVAEPVDVVRLVFGVPQDPPADCALTS